MEQIIIISASEAKKLNLREGKYSAQCLPATGSVKIRTQAF